MKRIAKRIITLNFHFSFVCARMDVSVDNKFSEPHTFDRGDLITICHLCI